MLFSPWRRWRSWSSRSALAARPGKSAPALSERLPGRSLVTAHHRPPGRSAGLAAPGRGRPLVVLLERWLVTIAHPSRNQPGAALAVQDHGDPEHQDEIP